jgi:hypothetical protein
MGGGLSHQWALGPIAEVMGHLHAHSSTDADLAAARAELVAAEPDWRSDPATYAEHYGVLSDLFYRSYLGGRDPTELDAAFVYWRRVDGIDRINAIVRTRLRNHGIQLDVARARRDGGIEAASACLSSHCDELREELKEYGAPTLLGDLARIAASWGDAAAEDDAWSGAADAYELAARAVDALFRTVPYEERSKVLFDFRGTDATAASALGRAGRWTDAVATLEASRQRLTRFLRGGSDAERILSRENPELLSQLRADHQARLDASSAARHITDASAARQALEDARAASRRFVETLGRVRQYPGLEHYMIRPSFEEVRKASQERPTAYVSTSRYDTMVILVDGDGTVRGTVDVTLDQLLRVISDWVQVLDHRLLSTERARHRTLALVGKALERMFTSLLRDVLTYRWTRNEEPARWRWGPVTLVISGPLAFMPVHAWSPMIRDADGKTVSIMPLSYAPSARQAAVARRAPQPDGSTRSLLSLADPEPRPDGLVPLPCARLEAATIAESALRRSLLRGADATPEAFLALAGEHEVIHLACHAQIFPGSPLESRIELAGAALTGQQIVQELALDDVALVVLSACRSGQQDPYAPDESLDLASLFLAAGARAVLTNLWPIDDLAAGLFIWRMFEAWDWGRGLALASAVSHAGLWLKDLTVRDLNEFADGHPGWRGPIRRRTRFLSLDLKRFNEPYYWSTFALTGG